MIKLTNAIVVANTSEELTALQELLAPLYPKFVFETLDNAGEEKDNFPFKMLVVLNTEQSDLAMPSMPDFLNLLLAKIDQLNQPA